MDDNKDYIKLVEKAQRGDKDCLNRLAEAARLRLCEYVHRLTLQEDLTQDIVQESILEMFKVFHNLKRTDRFWPWLYSIAFNKVRSHYGKQWRQKTVFLSDARREPAGMDSPDGLAEMIAAEWKQAVVKSIQQLEPRHRAVLTMRCYDQMPHSEIAKIMGCTELGVRALFCRAKKALAKQLSHRGLSKEALLASLVLFGKMTATTEAAAAKVSVTAATVKVGAAASLAAIATSKTAVVSLAAAGVVAAGSLAITPSADKINSGPQKYQVKSSFDTPPQPIAGKGSEEYWYYYPSNTKGVVMMQLKSNAGGKQSYCHWLQNDQANYHHHNNTIYINNCRMWASDLAVRRLPTDNPQLTDFLSQVEGHRQSMKYVPNNGDGLLVIVRQDETNNPSQITHRHDVLDEEYFRYDWPTGAKVVDNRDAMHERGWTYFRITGQVNGEEVSGAARIPFVYAASKRYGPWLRLQVRDTLRIADNGARACLYDGGGKVIARYTGGSFFAGLTRPWMGLHTIDTVRRDAAQQKIWFETKLASDGEKAKVTLTHRQTKLTYTIDMKGDVIEKITFSTNDQSKGELRFSYLQEIDQVGTEFTPPRIKGYGRLRRKNQGILWLVRLAGGKLGQ